MKVYLYLMLLAGCYGYLDANHCSGGPDISQRESEYDRSNHIERPCYLSDTDCIRRVLAHNLMCSPAHGPVPNPAIVKRLDLEMSHCNITLVLIDARIENLDTGEIREFYINRKTDTLVLEVEFDSIIVDTPVTIATYRRKGKEPVKLRDASFIEFKNISFTVNIKNFSNVHLAKSHVYTYFSEAKPTVDVGPGISGTKDPLLKRMNKKWVDEIALSAQEAFLVQGPVYMSIYMNNMICDLRRV